MSTPQTSALLHHLRQWAAGPWDDPHSDRELLQRFAAKRDEAAFAALVRRHGPMVLRVYLRNTEKEGWFAPPAVESLVQRARRSGLAGATILRGILGLDITGRLLESSAWSLVDHVPVIVEIVDAPQAIGSFLTVIAQTIAEGMATLERAHVILYRHSGAAGCMNSFWHGENVKEAGRRDEGSSS